MEVFGPYRLDSLVGRGGMGEVYRAFDTRRNRTVALKRLPADLAGDQGFESRFRRESELAARLREPHVIPIHDFGEIDGRLFIDMRLVDGLDLATVLGRNGPMPVARAVHVVEQVASALDAAHADGLLHRDVKPSNVLLLPDGFAYLIDFGIARDLGATTTLGSLAGTVAYMAPERFAGAGRGDHRVDVYALACLLFEALTGRRPFPGDDALAQMYAHANTEPPRPTSVRRDLPAGLDEVVAVGMAKDPAGRYPSAGALAAAARRAVTAELPATAPRATAAIPVLTEPSVARGPWWRRWPVVVAAAVVVAVVVAVAATVAIVAATTAEREASVVSTVAVGDEPARLALSPDGSRAYVTNFRSGTLSVVDTATAEVVATVDVGAEPLGVVVSADGGRAYVAGSQADQLLLVDTVAARVIGSVGVYDVPGGVALSADGTRAYVANRYSGSVSVIDTIAQRHLGFVPVGERPLEVGGPPDGGVVYVTKDEETTLAVIDTATESVTGIDLGAGQAAMAFAPDGRRAYVALHRSDAVAVLDLPGGTVSARIPVGDEPFGVAGSQDGTRVYVANSSSDTVSVIDTATAAVVDTIVVPGRPRALAVSPDGGRVYVAAAGSDSLLVIDTGR